jgi:hypothetical protein
LGDKTIFDFYKTNYITATYKIDSYHLFYERGFSILRNSGLISFISPNTFLKNKYARNLRELLLNNKIIEIVNFYIQVFEDASVDTLILMTQKKDPSNNVINYLAYTKNIKTLEEIEKIHHIQESFNKGDYEIELDINIRSLEILKKLNINTLPLSEIGRAYFGIQTFDRKKFVSREKLSDDYYPIIDGSNVKRYYYEPSIEFVQFKKEAIKSGGDESVYKRERIVVRQIGVYPEGTIVPPYLITLNTIYNIFLFDNKVRYPLLFVLGIINSRLIQYFWKSKYYDNKATFPKIKKEPIESIPIISYGSDDSQQLVIKVAQIINIKRQNPASDVTKMEKEINQLVYQLYGLTEEEIRIVEN